MERNLDEKHSGSFLRKTPKDDQERLRLYNLPFELLRGHVYSHFSGCIGPINNKWRFRYRDDGKPRIKSFYTLKKAKAAQEAWVYERPFDRCGTVYVQFGDELLCRGKSGAKWWMSAVDKDLLDQTSWSYTKKGYIQGIVDKKQQRMHRVIMERQTTFDPKKPQVDHVNHVTYDNRRSNLRWVSSYENATNNNRTSINTGRVGISIDPYCYRFVVSLGSYKKYFHYRGYDWKDSQCAWHKALICRIDHERSHPHMHQNHTDYLVRKPLLREYWESMQTIVRQNMDKQNKKDRERKTKKRKGSPVVLGNKDNKAARK